MTPGVSRRRVLGITAAAAGLALLPFGRAAKAERHVVRWSGTALGAAATMQIHHFDRAAAENLIQRSLGEIRRLERLFSLYREDSTLSVLNRRGAIEAPPHDFVDLLEESRRYADLTGHRFDPSVQPLWALYAEHFSGSRADHAGPSMDAVNAALAKVGFADVLIGRDRVAFGRRGMMLTLNGIAQGYITDRVVALLRAGGIDHSLVDIGESRAIGTHPDGRSWQVGITDPERPDRIGETIEIVDQAVASSAGYGFRFDREGRVNHLFNPVTGASARRYRSVTTVMPNATAADALSTAFHFMPAGTIEEVLGRLGAGRVHLITEHGETLRFTA